MRYVLLMLGGLLMLISTACDQSATTTTEESAQTDSVSVDSSNPTISPGKELNLETVLAKPDTSLLERTILSQGLVNILSVDPDVRLDMKYSTEDNFLKADVYGDFSDCYLQAEVAEMLARADSLIQDEHPSIRLLIYDCVRPRSVQYQMWDIVKGTDQQNYVAPPGGGGSMHNYGAAVDLGLTHIDSGIVDMGTPFDYFGKLAQPRFEAKYLQSGELNQQQIENRLILRRAMRAAGFHMIMSEWWHFNGFERPEVRRRYQIVE
ncbi:MAG: M15 family metallopeptidase [Bacteroidota bacterium]